ncbi:hypothetical protein [Actinacidiphila glaucinigra]|uniref:Uncharacterized protein n=1 Tax=Actinacidiphila glaucinigra TaxID=235986 RepID=A0A239HNR4_9ACTN|nr:hypothetical protein SAMN05216252_10913 [Actinacidiphila glaucinigra]
MEHKRDPGGMYMETVPGIFAGTVFAVFGAALLAWTVTRSLRHLPVVQGGGPASVAVAGFFGVVSLLVGVWLFLIL